MISGLLKTVGKNWLLTMGMGGVLLGGSACSPEQEAGVPEAESAVQQLAAAPIGQTIWLKACTNAQYVSADQNINASVPLVANRAAAQGWEQFQVKDGGSGYVALLANSNGKYVSADPNANGQLTASKTAVGDWERFQWVSQPDGTVSLLAKSTAKYVSADSNLANVPLVANRAAVGCWEAFSWGAVGGTTGGWVQIWSDEFDGTSLNTANWSYNTAVHVNNEQQQYTSSSQNVQVSNGTLKLIARYQPTNGYPYTSGRIESAGKREFGHSRVEARIKLPVGAGLWPAFWMLGNDINTVGWPNCGEFDIMENVGYGDWTSGALHGPGYYGNTPINGRFYPNSAVSNWHVYRGEYSSADIKWYIDDVLVKTTTRAEVTQYGPYAYDHPFYIILNLAVGGGYPFGLNGATTPYYGVPQSTANLIAQTPQVMEVDWVRVYQWQ